MSSNIDLFMNMPSTPSMEEAMGGLEEALHGAQEVLEQERAVQQVARSIFANPQAAPENDS